MQKRKLGASGICVNPVGLGCMGFNPQGGPELDKNYIVRTIQKAYDIGYDFFDTSQLYYGETKDGAPAYNESLVGLALSGVRSKVVIATKTGARIDDQGRILADNSPEAIKGGLNDSLKRLGGDYVDLYYLEKIDPNVEPEKVAMIMAELIEEGKIRAWGLVDAPEDYIRRAHAICPISALQHDFSLLDTASSSLFALCVSMDMAFVASAPLAGGLLTGENQARVFNDEANIGDQARLRKFYELMGSMAAANNLKISQIAIAWALSKSQNLIAIPGSRNYDRLKSNFDAASVKLAPKDLEMLDDLAKQSQ